MTKTRKLSGHKRTSVAGRGHKRSGRRSGRRSRNKRIRTLKTRRRQRNLKGGTQTYYIQGQTQGPATRYSVAHSQKSPRYEVPVKQLSSIYKTPQRNLSKTPYEGEYATLRHKLRDNKDYGEDIEEWVPGVEYKFDD